MITADADIMSVYHAAETRRFYNEDVRSPRAPRAVLFDLDDTLFDHEQAARVALLRVHEAHSAFTEWRFDAFEQAHARVLEELHVQVLSGERTVDDAREERFRRLFTESDAPGDDERVRATAAAYREAYLAARRPVDGAREVLAALKPRVRIGIVSNNLLEEQQAKIRLCGFDPYVDALVVSEAVGIAKPDPAIFAYALEKLDCAPEEAVMVGDSWVADIAGAHAAGIRPIWFNRARRQAPDASCGVCEVFTLTPMDELMSAVFLADRPSDLGTGLRCASA
jgi:YjjG family noncanonical pyrimidine nucleotidase